MAARKEQSESSAKASVNLDELRELIALLRENGLAELELEREDFRVRLRREGTAPSGDHAHQYVAAPAPVAAPATNPSAATAANPSESAPSAPSQAGGQSSSGPSADQDLHIIPSPIVGTFYRSPSPTADPFVKIGSNVEPASVVCIIEAMKLMNEIQAEASGEVVKIYVENGQPVEYGQPLFGIRS